MGYTAILLILTSVSFSVLCSSDNDLQIKLMNGYNRNRAPTLTNETLIAEVKMHLFAITDFDEISEVISTNSWFVVTWTDQRLRWNVTEYDTSVTYFRQEQLWHPDLTIINSIDNYEAIGYNDLVVAVSHDGAVKWEPGKKARTLCEVNTEYFPFDKQTCVIEMIPWAQRRPHSDVRSGSASIHLTNYYENGLWEIKSTSVSEGDLFRFTMLKFSFVLKRRYEYFITAIIVPVLVLSFLNCFSFVLPYESGEKMTFSTAILLSYTVLLTYTNDTLPKTSKYTSTLVTYISIMLCLSCVSVVCTLLGMLFRRDHESLCSHSCEKKINNKFTEDVIKVVLEDSNIGSAEQGHNCEIGTIKDNSGRQDNNEGNKRRSCMHILILFFRIFVNYFMFAAVVLATIMMTATTFSDLIRHNV